MLVIVGWIVWSITIAVSALIGLLHCALSIPKAIAGNDDGPSAIPLIGELTWIVAVVTIPNSERWPSFVTFGVAGLHLIDYTSRGIAASRRRGRGPDPPG